jgi:hypothetical protein
MWVRADVRFDWEGSLDLARRLWRFADDLDELRRSRSATAARALESWRGAVAVEFGDRLDHELIGLEQAASRLREGACDWAAAWTRAIDQQNHVLHARACERARSERSLLEQIGGWLVGHDLPEPPAPRPVPQPPAFVPQRGFAVYSVLD